jgi:hypothetical protein
MCKVRISSVIPPEIGSRHDTRFAVPASESLLADGVQGLSFRSRPSSSTACLHDKPGPWPGLGPSSDDVHGGERVVD